jgi:hypothetical protein
MWISSEQLPIILKHKWYSAPFTESSTNYVMYHDRMNVDVYTLRFNLYSPTFSEDWMLDTLLSKVMDRFSNASTVVGVTGYDMLLSSQDPNEKTYYIFRANSNQRQSSHTIETVLSLDQHEIFLFGREASNVDLNDLAVEFRSSGVVIAAILSIVFSFFSL